MFYNSVLNCSDTLKFNLDFLSLLSHSPFSFFLAIFLSLSRSTAFGIQAAAGRVGAIVGTVLFGQLTEVNQYLPILVVASSLTIGALAVFFLPLSKKWKKRLRRFFIELSCFRRQRRYSTLDDEKIPVDHSSIPVYDEKSPIKYT